MTEIAIFDMDGTLVDTNCMTARAFRELAGEYGLPLPSERVIRDAIGLPDLQFYHAIYPDEPDEKLRPFGAAVERREGELGRTLGGEVLFPGVRAMLEKLSARGVKLYLASTGSKRHVQDMLGSGEIASLFLEIHCAEPDKEAMTADILAAAGPGSAVFIGDTLKDVNAARANGIPALGAGFGYVKEADAQRFDRVFESPEALTEYLLA